MYFQSLHSTVEQGPPTPVRTTFLAGLSCWCARKSRWGASQPLSPWSWGLGLAPGCVCSRWKKQLLHLCQPNTRLLRNGAPRAVPIDGNNANKTTIINTLHVAYHWHSNASVSKSYMPLSFSSLNNVNYFSALRHGSSGMQKAVLCSHAIPLTASPLSLFCSFQYSCLQSSRKRIKRGFS